MTHKADCPFCKAFAVEIPGPPNQEWLWQLPNDSPFKQIESNLDECADEIMKLPKPPREIGDGPQERVDWTLRKIKSLSDTIEDVRDWIADPFVDVELTDRECKVITLASRGVSVITIAGRLGVGRQTVYEEVWRSLVKINKVRDCELNLENLSEETFRQLKRIVR